jgi:hypothetical protein
MGVNKYLWIACIIISVGLLYNNFKGDYDSITSDSEPMIVYSPTKPIAKSTRLKPLQMDTLQLQTRQPSSVIERHGIIEEPQVLDVTTNATPPIDWFNKIIKLIEALTPLLVPIIVARYNKKSN